jgi:hypothetical protein
MLWQTNEFYIASTQRLRLRRSSANSLHAMFARRVASSLLNYHHCNNTQLTLLRQVRKIGIKNQSVRNKNDTSPQQGKWHPYKK